jgi:hypothetical protein
VKIINEPPPNYEEIRKVFDVEAKRPIFAWGTLIYNPFGANLEQTPELIAHEEMHGYRQLGPLPFGALTPEHHSKIRLWWRDYLESPSFRLEEEIPAHRAEYRQLLRMYGNTRRNRRLQLIRVAKRMRDPLYQYNNIFSFEQAKFWISLDETEMKGE